MASYDQVKNALEDISDIIKVIFKTEYALVQCPFHKNGQETNPSLMVNLTNTRFDVGFSYCLSCGAKHKWADLCVALDIDEVDTKTSSHKYSANNQFTIKPLKVTKPLLQAQTTLTTSWNPAESWRGIHGQLLANLGASLKLDSFTKDKQIVLPCAVAGKVVGNINAFLQKRSKGQGSSYINSPGSWVKEALFPYDYVASLLQQTKGPVCLVEGPRDALNLIQYGISALAILGCTNWSSKCIPLLLALFPNATKLIIMMDNDEAGQKATTTITQDLAPYNSALKTAVCNLTHVNDPAELTETDVTSLKQIFI